MNSCEDLQDDVDKLEGEVEKLELSPNIVKALRYINDDNDVYKNWTHEYDNGVITKSTFINIDQKLKWSIYEVDDENHKVSNPPVKKTILTHVYEDGKLVKSESEDFNLEWSWTDKSLDSIKATSNKTENGYNLYLFKNFLITSMMYFNENGKLQSEYKYEYNNAGLLTKEEDVNDKEIKTYSYDANNNLIEYKQIEEKDVIVSTTFTYDTQNRMTNYVSVTESSKKQLGITYTDDATTYAYIRYRRNNNKDDFEEDRRSVKKLNKNDQYLFYDYTNYQNSQNKRTYEYDNEGNLTKYIISYYDYKDGGYVLDSKYTSNLIYQSNSITGLVKLHESYNEGEVSYRIKGSF
jgi:hypothetical protein